MTVAAEALLGRGYFPKELPPSFTTLDFASKAAALESPLARSADSSYSPRACSFNLLRPGSLRRQLAIVNPFVQLHLCREIARGWNELDKHFAQSQIALSRPVSDDVRAVAPAVDFANRAMSRLPKMNRARFGLATDVSQFYPSVYTHSLGWALDGKVESKRRWAAARRREKLDPMRTLGENLDSLLRAGQEAQTKGIPIGPDTSFLLAEALLTAIDVRMQKRFETFERSAMRFFDDLEFFSPSRRYAEEVLQAWEAELAEFELVLNPDKTAIEGAPFAIESAWHGELSAMRVRDTSDLAESNDILEFFDRAFGLAKLYPKDTVINFAIRRFKDWSFSAETWKTYFQLLLPAVIAEPSAIPHLTQALAMARDAELDVPEDRLEETLNELAAHHAQSAHAAETLWALWTLVETGLPLDETAALDVVAMGDSSCALVLLHLAEKMKVDTSPLIARAEDMEAPLNGDWLLAYEAARHGWADPGPIESHAEFRELASRDVSFFDPSARVGIDLSGEEY